ncbi:AMP-binding protein [Actinoalloteichus hymeniacidonis]|uniref:Acyl-CoA synthetase (AMP-forming)/AMP-acid ligase II n=1 Tax=Actinoalloteichus hymeniacidonis TaxID=340345 RepID=A0AAC9MWH3_9PSEU|nr:AMP-binding protein [Actinoalloteichus hymeniacidonis]AOS62218.1 acyl-CoA synthetase (AMP-forming)/AMP-acid ligase II [Actinoalloteichus hymeniacidonis]MBB5909757.1 fatty-acyl-CoA synthase [Actinoalloteichus hymeniacidonis]
MTAQDPPNSVWSALHGIRTLIDNGVLRPMRPDRLVRLLAALWRWNTSLALGFATGAVRHPDRPAVIDEHGAVSYAELNDRTTRLANGLADLGIREGSWLGVLCGNHRALVETLVAGSKLGANILLLTNNLSPAEITRFLDTHQVDTVIADHDLAPRLPVDERGLTVLTAWTERTTSATTIDQLILDSEPTPRPRRQRSDQSDDSVVMLTSSSHGLATSVPSRTPSRITPAATVFGRIPLAAGERTLMAAPLSHTWGMSALHLTVVLGATLILLREPTTESILTALKRYRCTSMFARPDMLRGLVDAGPPEGGLPALRAVVSTGGQLPGDLAARFRNHFGPVLHNLYGTTELSWVSIATPADLRRAPGTVGRPPRDIQVTVRDESGRLLPPDETGQIFVEGAGWDRGFDENSVAQSSEQPGRAFTGDLGHFDATGLLFVDGSKRDVPSAEERRKSKERRQGDRRKGDRRKVDLGRPEGERRRGERRQGERRQGDRRQSDRERRTDRSRPEERPAQPDCTAGPPGEADRDSTGTCLPGQPTSPDPDRDDPTGPTGGSEPDQHGPG